jgi:phospholipid transport system substrate-binding protein
VTKRLVHTQLAMLLACACLAPASIAEVAPAVDPATKAGAPAVIGRFNEMLLDLMQRADELGYRGRFELVDRSVAETFDISFMAAKSIGSYWRKLDDEKKAHWVRTFSDFTVSTYADRFDGYSGQSFAIVGEKPASHDTLVILTRLVRPDKDDVDLDYRMREGDEGWRVVDVYSDGKVSEVALRRSEYAAVLKQGGIDKLIDAVSKKTAKRAAKHS